MESVCPALGIVADDPLADPGPFQVVPRRIQAVGLPCTFIFNGHPQTEERFHTIFHQGCHQQVCEHEIIGRRILGIRVKVPEQIGHIHVAPASQEASHIVKPGEGNLQIMEHTEICPVKGRLSYPVYRLYLP